MGGAASCDIAILPSRPPAWEGPGTPMVVVEMRCTCGAYERIGTSEFALLMRIAQLRRDHEGDGHEVRIEEHDWQPGEPC